MVTQGKKFERLQVGQKSGFRNINGEPIVILDDRGEIFYDTRKLLKRVKMFNLPAGNYYIAQGKIKKMSSAVNYPLAEMPPKEREIPGNFSNFDMYFVDNPNTGTVSPLTKEKFYDHDLKTFPLPYMMFIDEHENGHKFYVTEQYCDRYAANKMLERGYNPSQISEAIILTLSPNKADRKEAILRSLLGANLEPDNFEKDFPNVQWNTEPILANPLLFWNDWWNAKTWMRWHTKVMEKYGRERANEVFLIWWQRAPILSPTIDYRTFDEPFIAYAKTNGFYDSLFSGLGGLLGKTAGAGVKTVDAAGNVIGAAGDTVSSAGKFAKFLGEYSLPIFILLLVAFLIFSAKKYAKN